MINYQSYNITRIKEINFSFTSAHSLNFCCGRPGCHFPDNPDHGDEVASSEINAAIKVNIPYNNNRKLNAIYLRKNSQVCNKFAEVNGGELE
ncbi:hypothetical protein O3M35_007578 [Rhynocoris fuscipes]|uniref:Uncharacterized protein n=1 Tax=Rhynocoris fuscipes TaxID=488301 RepID=A0AAW1DH50_9HEMI